jgi:hypothetical protein
VYRITHVLTGDSVDNIIRRSAKELSDDGELVDVVLSREKRFALKHLSENAASTPDINLNVVFLPGEHNLGSSVVSCRNITSHLGVLDSGKTKVADLQIAVFVDENVTGLEVAVDNAGRMHVLETTL